MKQSPSIREIFVWVAFLVSAYFAFVKKWDNVQLQEGKIRSEERIKTLEQNATTQAIITDSLESSVKAKEAVIEYQKKNPKIIIEKYDKVRNNVNVLNADESIRYLSTRLSKEGGNR